MKTLKSKIFFFSIGWWFVTVCVYYWIVL